MDTMRDYMFRRFGAGQPEILRDRVRIYLLGMPDPHGVPFPPRVDIEIKLDELEEEGEYLLGMCPADMRDTYEDGKEETLVRILVRHLPAEYDLAVKAVKDLMARLRKYSEGGKLDAITNCEDNTRANYATDYLPNYSELRVELINTYQLAERRRSEMNKRGGKKGHPSFPIMDGHTQPGPGQQSCYHCGVKGHRAGDPACRGKEGEVHKDAPEWFRKQGENPQRGGRGRGNGKGKGKGKQKGGGRKGRPLCQSWSKGTGYCRYAADCKFAHDDPQGGGKRQWKDSSTALPTKAVKLAKKEIMSIVVEALSEKGEEKATVQSASDSLLEFCRGLKKSKSVGMIALDIKSPDYVPSLPKPTFKSVLMNFSQADSDPEHKPDTEPKPREHVEINSVFESESEKELEEIRNVGKVMSKRKRTKPKIKKIKNDKNIFRNLNDVHILNDVENEGNLCGPENSGQGKFEAAHDVGGGSESEKDEIEEDDNAESWVNTRVKGWLRPRVKTRRMNESAPEIFWRQGTGGPRAILNPRPPSLTHRLTLNLPAGLAVSTQRCRMHPTPTP